MATPGFENRGGGFGQKNLAITTEIFEKSKIEQNIKTESKSNITNIVDAGNANEGPSIMEDRTFGSNLDMFRDRA